MHTGLEEHPAGAQRLAAFYSEHALSPQIRRRRG
ncbi:hypothetical protein [Candidatus Pantoea persica]|nr:hypothetical protein [Candidatus Pantoea persica]